ncbi:MAG: gamma carbonic anhydrase family protein [Candidatus Lokiarchaeota archaeon]|nr:gamma carbonic anhydrase family protein [Candidatus Lokiarchaeota archaeon]
MPCPRTGKIPKIHETAYIAPTAVIIGDVIIGERSNIWFGAVLRGDFGSIEIGKNTSIQENTTIHMEAGTFVKIGDNCIIGHHAMIHGPCTIGNGCLIGIGSNILHRSTLGDGVTVGAGAVVLGKEFPSRCLVVGIPADLKKSLPQKGKMEGEKTSEMYAENGKLYKDFFSKNPEFF